MSALEAVLPASTHLPIQRGPQDHTPLLDLVAEEIRVTRARAYAPGHLGGLAVSPEVLEALGEDTFRGDVWIDPARLAPVQAEAEALAADFFGAQRGWFLTGGSSSGNRALLSTLPEGSKVLVARDVHRSVLAGLENNGAWPIWLPPTVHRGTGLPLGVEAAVLVEAFGAHPDATSVVLSSPSYASTCTDLEACAAVAAAHGASLLVDSAWGPHGGLDPDVPPSALQAGALATVTSLHKMISPATSGVAILLASHAASPILLERLTDAVRKELTTSPDAKALASADAARHQLWKGNRVFGGGELAATIAVANRFREHIALIPGLNPIGHRELGLPARRFDPTRVIVDVKGLGLSGYQVQQELGHNHVRIEGADSRRIYLGFGTRPEAAAYTTGAVLAELQQLTGPASRGDGGGRGIPLLTSIADADTGDDNVWGSLGEEPQMVMSPRAANQAAWQRISSARAVDDVAAENVVQYPPGITIVTKGQRLTRKILKRMNAVSRAGGHLECVDPSGATIRVVKR